MATNFRGKIYSFGFGKGRIALTLSADEQTKKLAALQCYSSKSSADGGLPKWTAEGRPLDTAPPVAPTPATLR